MATKSKNLPAPKANALDECAKIANQAIEEYLKSSIMAVLDGIKAGLALEKAKEESPHGTFEKWMTKNIRYKETHCRRLRTLANAFCNENDLSLDQALKLCYTSARGHKTIAKKARAFIGDNTQADLFAQYGIATPKTTPSNNKAAQIEAKLTKEEECENGDSLPRREARHRIGQLRKTLYRLIPQKKVYAHLPKSELNVLYQDLKDYAREVKSCIDKG